MPELNPTEPSDAPIGFKSKVVSRRHCEFSVVNGQWHIKDVGSSSGTFLNRMRLSQPNMVSRLYAVRDGDIVQLGIDFRGGEEMIFRCVRIRIECNRGWQQQPNEFKYVCHADGDIVLTKGMQQKHRNPDQEPRQGQGRRRLCRLPRMLDMLGLSIGQFYHQEWI